MDLAGVAILLGVLLALFRRVVLRPRTLESRWDDYYAIALLLLIPLLGFTTEGLRILATAPEWAAWSPVGNLTARLFGALGVTPDGAWAVHGALFWAHMLAGLLLVASIPFTKLRHLITVPVNVVTRELRRAGVLSLIENIEEAEVLGATQVTELAPRQLLALDACVRCGRCEEVCPAAIAGVNFSPRAFVQSLRAEMTGALISGNGGEPRPFGESEIADTAWACTTCGACLAACPAYVSPVDDIIDVRRGQALMTGKMPGPVGLALRNIERQNNPWGLPAADRTAWAEGLDIPLAAPGEPVDVLLFTGCAFAYDDRNRKVAESFVKLLQAAEVNFAMLGDAEMCCGETARRLGHEYLFQMLAQENIQTLKAMDFDRIVTQCPHCFNTLKNEYPALGGDFRVQHYAEYLAEIADSLPSNGHGPAGTITFHDSCYLGRYNDIYDAPRALLDANGAPRVEMERRRQDALCCGGGGGQMWMETESETRINHVRLEDALATGAEVVATACPYCLLMFDDAIRSKGVGEQLRVLDVAEVLAGRAG